MFSFIKRAFKIATVRERKVVLENFFSLSTLQGLNYVLPILILPYIIRVIGPERFGLLAFAQAFVQYFMIVTDYGFGFSATREISLCRKEKSKVCSIFSSVMIAKLLLALLSFLLLLAIITFVPRFKQDWLVYIFSFGVVIGNTLFPVWFFQGTEKMKYIAVLQIIAGIAFIIGVCIFVRKSDDYLLIPLIYSLILIVTGLVGLSIVFRKFNVTFVYPTFETIEQQMKAGWNIFISIVAINAYTTTRIFAVGLLTNNALTGYYSIAERIGNVIQTFPLLALSQAIYPRLINIYGKNKRQAVKIMYKIQKVTTSASLISIPVLSLLAPWIVRIVCGQAYPEVVIVLRILLIPIFFICANAFRVQFLLVSNKSDYYSRIHISMALIGCPLIFISILFFSYLGAALCTILIEGAIFTLTTYYLLKATKKIFP